MICLKSAREIERMRDACKIVSEVLAILSEMVLPGITTIELDEIACKEAHKHKAKPAFKGYHNYPNALCCSPNEQVVHGMPTAQPLKSGDILSLDFGVQYNDFFGDSAITVPVGDITTEANNILQVAKSSLYLGIEKALVGGRLFDISYAIQQHVESNGYFVVRDFVGHGIGRKLHEEPQVPNYGSPGKGVLLKPGMVLAIEPMINALL